MNTAKTHVALELGWSEISPSSKFSKRRESLKTKTSFLSIVVDLIEAAVTGLAGGL
jgi:hypothetical protein